MDARNDDHDHNRLRRRRRCRRGPRTVPLTSVAAAASLLMCGPPAPSGSGWDGSPFFVSSFGFGVGSLSASRGGARNVVGWGTRGWSLSLRTSPPRPQPHVPVPSRRRGLLASATDEDGDGGDGEESSPPPPWFLSATEEEDGDGGTSDGRVRSTANVMKGSDGGGIGSGGEAVVDDDGGDDHEPPLVENGKPTSRGSGSRGPADAPLDLLAGGRRAGDRKVKGGSTIENEDDEVPVIEGKTVRRVPGSYKPAGTPLNASTIENVVEAGETAVDGAAVDEKDSVSDEEGPIVRGAFVSSVAERYIQAGSLLKPLTSQHAKNKKNVSDSVIDVDGPSAQGASTSNRAGSCRPAGTLVNGSTFENVEDGEIIVDSAVVNEKGGVVGEGGPARGASVSSGAGSYKPFRLLKPLTSQQAKNKKNASDGVMDEDGPSAQGASESRDAKSYKPVGTNLNVSTFESVADGGTMAESPAGDESGNAIEDEGSSLPSAAGSYKPFRLLKPLTSQQAESKKNISDGVIDEDGPSAQGASKSHEAGSYKPARTVLSPFTNQQLQSKNNVSDGVIDDDRPRVQGASEPSGARSYSPTGTLLNPSTSKDKKNISDRAIDEDGPNIPAAFVSRAAGGTLRSSLTNQQAENKKNFSESAMYEDAPNVHEASESHGTGSYRPAGTLLNPLTNQQAGNKKNISDSVIEDGPSGQGRSASHGSYRPAGTLLNPLTKQQAENKKNISNSAIDEDDPSVASAAASRGAGSYRPTWTLLTPLTDREAENKQNITDSVVDEDGPSVPARPASRGTGSYRSLERPLKPSMNQQADSKKNVSDSAINEDAPSVPAASVSRRTGSYRPAGTILNSLTNQQAENKKNESDSIMGDDTPSIPVTSASRKAGSYRPMGTLLNRFTSKEAENKKNESYSTIDDDGQSVPVASASHGAESYRPVGTILTSLTNELAVKKNISDRVIAKEGPSFKGASVFRGAGIHRPTGSLLNPLTDEKGESKKKSSDSVVDDYGPRVQGESVFRGAGSYRPTGSLLNPSTVEHAEEAERTSNGIANDISGDKDPYVQRELVSRGSGSYEPVGSLLKNSNDQPAVDELAISDFMVNEGPILQGVSGSHAFTSYERSGDRLDLLTGKLAEDEETISDSVVEDNNNDEGSFVTGELVSRGSMSYEPVGSLLNHPAEQNVVDEAATSDFLFDEGIVIQGKSVARGSQAGEEERINDSVIDDNNDEEGPSVTGELISRGSSSYEPIGSLLNHPAEQNTVNEAATPNFVMDEGPIIRGKSLSRGFPSYSPVGNLLNPLRDEQAGEEETTSDSIFDDDNGDVSPAIPEDLISRGSRSYEPMGSLLNHPAEQNAAHKATTGDYVLDKGPCMQEKSASPGSRSYRPAGNLLNPLTNKLGGGGGGGETISHSVADEENGDEGPATPEELVSRGSRSYEPVGSLLDIPTEQQIVGEGAISGFVVNEGPIIQGISVSRGSTSYKPSGRLLDRSSAKYYDGETIIDVVASDDDGDEDPVVEKEFVSRRSEENGAVRSFLDPPATYEEVVSEFSDDDEAPNVQGVSEYPGTRKNKPSGTQLNFSMGNQAEDDETLCNGVVEDEEAIAQTASTSHSSRRAGINDDDNDESTVAQRTLASHGYMSYKAAGGLPNPPTDHQQTDEGPSAVQDIDSISDGNEARKEGRAIMKRRRKMQLSWCDASGCYTTSIRETVVGPENHITFDGPATGQVMYTWIDPDGDASTTNDRRLHPGSRDALDDNRDRTATTGLDVETLPTGGNVEASSSSRNDSSCEDRSSKQSEGDEEGVPGVSAPSVLLLVKKGDDELTKIAADAVRDLTADNIRVWLHPDLAARLKYYFGVEDDERIRLFEPSPYPGFGASHQHSRMGWGQGQHSSLSFDKDNSEMTSRILSMKKKTRSNPDLVVTLGGDGLLMYASSLFPGAVPPILCVAGGSLGFLTPFAKEEMLDAVKRSLGLIREGQDSIGDGKGRGDSDDDPPSTASGERGVGSVLPGMGCYAGGMEVGLPTENRYKHLNSYWGGAITLTKHALDVVFGADDKIALSMRMRLDCRIINPEGVVRARYNVLNEVVIDRGSSPYLANLECFCDDVHLTTVQADGIIFSTPTGSTAYSMAAGGSVVHPAVPAILVTPICPHVLSFRSMVFPDHVVLRTYVADDARAGACVAFDGKHRRELHRGDSVQIQMSVHPVPTINRVDQTFDWLNSLKRNFNFNSRVQQKPL